MRKNSFFVRGYKQKWPVSKDTFSFNTPIFETSTFIISSNTKANEIISRGGKTYFEGEDFIYTRGGNPTQRALEKTMALLEGAPDAVSYSSGMAAITNMAFAILEKGDHVVCGDQSFGDTSYLFEKMLPRFGITTTFVDTTNLDTVRSAIKPNTRLIFFETPNNPQLEVTDIKAICELTRRKNILVAVDSSLAGPFLQNPLKEGADIVIHSLTKLVGGHADSVGGIILANKKLISQFRQTIFITGAILSPFEAWNLLRGIKTLPIRMEKQCSSAFFVARMLQKHPKVKKVHYPGLASTKTYTTAKKQMSLFGSVVSFELKKGSRAQINQFIKDLKFFSFAVSFGCVESLVEHPASMTHNRIKREKVPPETLIRLSIGLEDENDLVDDLESALRKI